MKKKSAGNRKPKATTVPENNPSAPPDPGTFTIANAIDLSSRDSQTCEVAKHVYIHHVGAKAAKKLASLAFHDPTGDVAEMFISSLMDSIQPRDAIEEMLVVQMAIVHVRLARLSQMLADQELRQNIAALNAACDQAANTLRRLVLTLKDHRRPAATKVFAPISNANLAHQQLVQVHHGEIGIAEESPTNEQGLLAEVAPAVPAVGGGVGVAARGRIAQPAVAGQHGAADAGGPGPVEPERAQARPAERGPGRRDART